jgi:hypothetical protein
MAIADLDPTLGAPAHSDMNSFQLGLLQIIISGQYREQINDTYSLSQTSDGVPARPSEIESSSPFRYALIKRLETLGEWVNEFVGEIF